MAVKAITDDTFQNEIAGKTVLVDFWAEWCGPCRMVAPVVEELSKEMPSVVFTKMNVDENQTVAGSLSITAIPTLVLFKNGEIAERIVGFLPKEQLKKTIEKHLS